MTQRPAHLPTADPVIHRVVASRVVGNPNVPSAPRSGDVKVHLNLTTRF